MKKDLSSHTLHMLAFGLMLCDHLWATIVPGNGWLTWLGRMAFPLFAFLIAEGYFHTRDFSRYAKRIFLFALLSEIPFNLMSYSAWMFPFHQNVLWTFLLSLFCMRLLDKARATANPLKRYATVALLLALFWLLSTLSMADYGAWGLFTVLIFYFLRGSSGPVRLAQLAAMVYIHAFSMGSLRLPVTLFGLALEIPQQAMAVLALIPIWLYQGRQGPHSAALRKFYYLFYPVHMLILSLLRLIDLPA